VHDDGPAPAEPGGGAAATVTDSGRPGPASAEHGPIIVSGVTKEFEGGVVALDDVSFAAAPGEFVSIVGPSGCGKSTMLRLIAGLIPRSAGTIAVNGREVTKPRQDVALMFQRPTLLPWKTALQNAALPRELQGGVDRATEREAYDLLNLLGLEGFEHTYPRHLSGGMQQRVALARLLMVGVDVLLLDEPFAAVDQITRERLNVELLDVYERTRATAVLVTHNITEAVLLADRVIVMTPRPGRIAETLRVPFGRPRAPELAKEREFQELIFSARERLEHGDHGEDGR
jgi:NitT/TauT family transport system ATP-binding protein